MDKAIKLFAQRTAAAPQEIQDVETWLADGYRWVSGIDKNGDSISVVSTPIDDADDDEVRAAFLAAGYLAQKLKLAMN